VSFSRRCRSIIRLRIWACTDTSSAEVGSSHTRNSGRLASARAIEMRWRWPPENSCGYLRPSAGVSFTCSNRSPTCFSRSALSLERPKARLGDDVEHAPARIEAGERVLEDHLHPAPQGRVRALLAPGGHIVAVELDAAIRRRIEPDHEAGDRRLAATRLAHQRKCLALGNLDVDTVDGL